MSNRLANESSPYLLQHAHNPVDWYPWGEEAFERAVAEDKPVLVSIGYAACHWCHVMERESFEKEEVATIMNEHFVNIKVDREERPDVDAVYMDAVQAISGSGGWPLNVFLTPDKRPFYGGTYFPPRRAFNRASWTEVLQAVAQSYSEKRDEIETQAQHLTEHLQASNAFGSNGSSLSEANVEEAVAAILKQSDREWGGFGQAPKFPQTFSINFLLQWAWYERKQPEENEAGNTTPFVAAGGGEALSQALLSLNKMLQGGLYDHIGGGFARYSTDREWLVPHFEKMLYDNALLVSTLCDAYRFTGDEEYHRTISETLAFVERELMHPDGGFYSALDADSEGEEGKFYVWDREEVDAVLGSESNIFCDYFDIQPGGNWEGKSIPWVQVPLKEFAAQNALDAGVFAELINDGKAKLLTKRNERVRPQLDDKVLLSWNALMNAAYSKAYAATGKKHYRDVAIRNMQFLLSAFGPDAALHHAWRNGIARHPSFLDDYAYLIAALIELAQVTFDYTYFHRAASLTEVVVRRFADDISPLFFYTSQGQTDILLRKKEVYDGATPSGNATMALNLHRLSILLNKAAWRQQAEEMISAMASVVVRYPTSFGVWLSCLFELQEGTAEVVILGDDYKKQAGAFQKHYSPHSLLIAAEQPNDDYPLLVGKQVGKETLLFLCKNYACAQPVSTLSALLAQLRPK